MWQGEFDFEQAEHLERVSSRIARSIIDFCRGHKQFYAEELRQHVIATTGVAAPASADRILRDLRKRGIIDYVVLDRRLSFYQTNSVAAIEEPDERQANNK